MVFEFLLLAPNGLRMSRLADLAGYLPQNIVLGFNAVENTNEDTKPKAKSAPCACWAAFIFFFLLMPSQYHLLDGRMNGRLDHQANQRYAPSH
jgi:hypothetical protein